MIARFQNSHHFFFEAVLKFVFDNNFAFSFSDKIDFIILFA